MISVGILLIAMQCFSFILRVYNKTSLQSEKGGSEYYCTEYRILKFESCSLDSVHIAEY